MSRRDTLDASNAGVICAMMPAAKHGDPFRVRTKENRVYHFPRGLASPRSQSAAEYPIGRIADLCGNWLAFERQGQHVVAIQESAGRRLELVTRGGLLREVALVDAATAFRHVFVRYEYDEAGNLVSGVDAIGHPYTFGYDEHHLIRHTDRRGLSF
jgi:YD repeat-containing protein